MQSGHMEIDGIGPATPPLLSPLENEPDGAVTSGAASSYSSVGDQAEDAFGE